MCSNGATDVEGKERGGRRAQRERADAAAGDPSEPGQANYLPPVTAFLPSRLPLLSLPLLQSAASVRAAVLALSQCQTE